MKRFLQPKYFLIGIIMGFVISSIGGYIVSKHMRYHHFVRFTSYIGPTLDYFPTASELLMTAKHEVSSDKILVLIGGNSILRGEGQNDNEIWTKELQNILGNQFKVLNYGFNGAHFSSFGGAAFRMLSEIYPKIIFVSTCTFADEAHEIDGGNLYGYLFWDAYYKNLFHPDKNEKQKIVQLRRKQMSTKEGIELHFMSYLDSLFYFRNLWNWMGYQLIFTVYNKNVYPTIFKARRSFQDDVVDNETLAESVRKDTKRFKDENDVIIKMAFNNWVGSSGHYVPEKENDIRQTFDNVFESRYRSKILCVLSTYNPRNLSVLPQSEKEAYKNIISDTRSILLKLGYQAIQTQNMTPVDYIDFMHYVRSGGNKIAKEVAPIVKNIAETNNYQVKTNV
jgi:hypothetical protein